MCDAHYTPPTAALPQRALVVLVLLVVGHALLRAVDFVDDDRLDVAQNLHRALHLAHPDRPQRPCARSPPRATAPTVIGLVPLHEGVPQQLLQCRALLRVPAEAEQEEAPRVRVLAQLDFVVVQRDPRYRRLAGDLVEYLPDHPDVRLRDLEGVSRECGVALRLRRQVPLDALAPEERRDGGLFVLPEHLPRLGRQQRLRDSHGEPHSPRREVDPARLQRQHEVDPLQLVHQLRNLPHYDLPVREAL
ncbi:MerR family transcriptional regulator [Babesia caballi]|uniref:MerR family transcriptional regulator n=1 Tax=Babesia caballi TaxID=5871 RepID=A0AAV4M1S5_BABCB|nr:MerR family transcriptional regulator [Babesia caballi]